MHFFQTYVAFRTKNEALSRNLPRHNNLTSRSPAASNSLLRLAFSNHTLDLRIDLELLAIEDASNNSILATISFIFVPRVDAQATAVMLALANHLWAD
jgi:hypothetical protein